MTPDLRGSALMVVAMAGFAVEDVFLKAASKTLPVGEIMILFGFGGMCLFILLAWRAGEGLLHPAMRSRTVLTRAGFEVAGRLFYTLAIALTALSSAAAILQATPLVVVAGAGLIFGEAIGWRRWLALIVGFAGVLIILRPGLDGFTPLSLLAVLGTLGFAGRDLATRAAPMVLSNLQLGITGFAAILPAGAGLLIWSGGARWPDTSAAALLTAAIVTGVAAYSALTAAMRTGEVSVVTPFRYSRLLFAMGLGAAVFGERPDAWTLVGSAIVVATGIYTLMQARGPRIVVPAESSPVVILPPAP
jgi:drug/metabolite transporter (DMT)-like permease